MEKKSFNKGDVICREHDTGEEMYFILSGSAIPYKTVNNQKLELSAIEQGNFFGEMCLFTKSARTATVVAAEPTELLVLTRDNLLEKLQSDPRLGFKIIETLVHRLEFAHKVIVELEGVKSSFEMMYGRH